MMNLSMSHPVPTYGDSFTVTCYVCGMPSSKEWAQKVQVYPGRPTTPQKPYYPFLLQITPVGGAILREDGSTYLCAFCHASLEAQWNVYESQQVVPPPNRKYNIQKFICAVCGVETYRKRIRALPFQEFPFLEKQRQPGSITLGNNPLAIVCLDCSETLWAQSAEYDRWGLPVHKRHFNWMARPPPPEDSVEATVARLPSGETQLPRCPPTEPTIVPPKGQPENAPGIKVLDSAIAAKGRSKGKGDSPKLDNASSPIPPAGRKTSLTSITPPALDVVGGYHSQQPPVVTVAPMSSHTTVISLRKDSVTLPPGMIGSIQGSATESRIYPAPASAVYGPAASYAPYVWGNATAARESSQRTIEAYPYGSSTAAQEGIHGPPGAWPWLPHPPADLMRYQTYVSSLQSKSAGESTVTRSPTHSAGSSGVVYRGTSQSPTTYTLSGRNQDRERSPLNDQRSESRRPPIGSGGSSDEFSYPGKRSPDRKSGSKSPKAIPRDTEKPSTSRSIHHKKLSRDFDAPTTSVQPSTEEKERTAAAAAAATTTPARSTSQDVDQEKLNRKELHIPKKRNWQAFVKDSQSLVQNEEKREEIPSHPKKKKYSLPVFDSPPEVPIRIESVGSPKSDTELRHESRLRASLDSAMDLSASSSAKSSKGSSGAKFMIEYLCQSETSKQGDSSQQTDDTAPRTSVIKCAPKVPSTPGEDEQFKYSETTTKEIDGDAKKAKEREDVVITEEPSSKNKPDVKDSDKEIASHCEINDNVPEEKSTDKIKDDLTVSKDDKEVEAKGNKERHDQDNTMYSDDDSKNEDLPNIEQFIKETITELLNREKETEQAKKEEVHHQTQFLNELGLVTPDKKIELEIKSVVSRHEKKTLPPLKLRVETKLGPKIDQKLKELLLKVALEDPSLFQDKPETKKSDFMAELGMKTAKKSEKTKREIKWRVVLMERMRRELRDAAARGVKHEWEKAEILKKFADCDLDSFFSSLSFASLLSPDEVLDHEKVLEVEKTTTEDKVDTKTENNSGTRVCINYPKYIPSYAVNGAGESTPLVKVEEVPPAFDADKLIPDCHPQPKPVNETKEPAPLIEPILKIPTIPSKRRLQSESSATTAASDTDADDSSDVSNIEDGKTVAVNGSPSMLFKLGAPSDPCSVRIDNFVQCSATYWEQMKQGIDEILSSLESSKEDMSTEEKIIQVEKIRKSLKGQLGDIKNIEKRLRASNKLIVGSPTRKSQKKE